MLFQGSERSTCSIYKQKTQLLDITIRTSRVTTIVHHQQIIKIMTTQLITNNNDIDICWFYIVQKCWYSGPNVSSPIDYLRLLPSVGEAEQVAYQSAHTYATGSRSPVVRTIQMPMTTATTDVA